MKEMKEMEEVFKNLTEENQNIITLMAKGMEVAQNEVIKERKE